VTATVESIPLITASILSKKLAAGLQGLVMDVKFGNGAFMATFNLAKELAGSLATVATSAGLPTTALLTDMNEPLASAAGNAVEVRYAIDYLTGKRREPRMHEVTVALGAEMLLSGRLVGSVDEGAARMEKAVASGKAAEVFGRMVTALGGPSDLMERPEAHLTAAPIIRAVVAPAHGHVTAIDNRGVGVGVVALGGGRTRAADTIDHAVGLTELAGLGQAVRTGDVLAMIHARTEASALSAERAVLAAYAISARPVSRGPLIAERIVA
jgi:thymidine phosphorylase